MRRKVALVRLDHGRDPIDARVDLPPRGSDQRFNIAPEGHATHLSEIIVQKSVK